MIYYVPVLGYPWFHNSSVILAVIHIVHKFIGTLIVFNEWTRMIKSIQLVVMHSLCMVPVSRKWKWKQDEVSIIRYRYTFIGWE